VKEIPLSNGMTALVDDEDYEWLSQYNWHACDQGDGYVYAIRHIRKPDGKRTTLRMHREIVGAVRREVVDHWDGHTLHNWRDNLRRGWQRFNAANGRKPSGTTSRFKGVYWNSERFLWQAQICVCRVSRSLGRYEDEEAAAMAYDRAAVGAFGEFARVNFPERIGHVQRAAC
jgi:hypothetical protein